MGLHGIYRICLVFVVFVGGLRAEGQEPDRPEDRAAIERIEDLGARIYIDPESPGDHSLAISLTGSVAVSECLKIAKKLKIDYYDFSLSDVKIQDLGSDALRATALGVSLAGTDSTNEHVEKLCGLEDLRRIDLTFTKVDDNVTATLNRFKKIDVLYLGGTRVGDNLLLGLERAGSLRTLTLSDTSITDGGLKPFDHSEWLEVLLLDGTNITDKALDHIATMRRLHMVNLCETKITDDGLKKISKMRNLSRIDISETNVTSTGISFLKDLQQLDTIGISPAMLSQQVIEVLKKLGRLKALVIYGKNDGRIAQLRKQIPGIEMTLMPPKRLEEP